LIAGIGQRKLLKMVIDALSAWILIKIMVEIGLVMDEVLPSQTRTHSGLFLLQNS